MVELSETFYVFIVATASALIGLILKLCYDSKCTDINLFCLKIKRDTAGEIDEDKFKIENAFEQANFFGGKIDEPPLKIVFYKNFIY